LAGALHSWGDAPGWDNNAPLALGWFFDWRNPGAMPQAGITTRRWRLAGSLIGAFWGDAPGWDNNAPLALGWFFDWRIPGAMPQAGTKNAPLALGWFFDWRIPGAMPQAGITTRRWRLVGSGIVPGRGGQTELVAKCFQIG